MRELASRRFVRAASSLISGRHCYIASILVLVRLGVNAYQSDFRYPRVHVFPGH